MSLRRLLVLAALALAPVTAAAQVPAVKLTPLVEGTGAHAGSELRLALQVELPGGYHVQSDRPRDPSLKPATLAIDTPDGFHFAEVIFPPAVDFPQKGQPEPLAVFEREFVIGARLTIDKGAQPGSVTIPGRFGYQACDDHVCYAPKTVDVAWTFAIVPTSSPVRNQSPDVFSRIAFGKGRAPDAPVASAPEAPPPAAADLSDLELFDSFKLLNKGQTGGYMNAAQFQTFLADARSGKAARGAFEGRGPLAIVAIVFLGGLALNLTPCVLPMIPINLAIIGAGSRASKRSRGLALGATYGAAMAIVYGVIGLVVILTAGTFGTINASPWFNAGIAVLFVFLGLAMFDVISIDFSRLSSGIRFDGQNRGSLALAFSMGAVAALLAGACVAPVVIQVVVFASNLYAQGTSAALALPFVLGLGMALPWPIAGAGLAALPKPGAWMVRVKQAMGVFILATAAYYGYVAYEILSNRWVDPASVQASVNAKAKEGWHTSLREGLLAARRDRTPVLVDFWATWCKNCLVMDRTTMEDPAVKAALSGYTRIKFQAEDPEAPATKVFLQRVGAAGLPAYAVLEP